MNKRGQFYLIMAIIIGLVIYSLYLPGNKIEEVTLFEDFSDISSNYLREAPKVVNHGIFLEKTDKEMRDLITQFSEKYLEQVRKKNPNINLVYIYSNGTYVFVKSYYDKSIIFDAEERSTIFGANQQSLNSVRLKVSGKEFEHQVPVEMKNFGDEFTSQTALSQGDVILDVGGIFHTFPIKPVPGNEFQFLIEAQNGQVVNVYQSTNTPYKVRF